MRVRCLRTALTREELDHIGPVWPRSNFHDLVEGQTSLVFGIYTYNGAVWLRIESKSGYLYPVPVVLFEVVDARASRFWEVRFRDGDFDCAPSLLFDEYFMDDLAESVPEVVARFSELRAQMDSE